MEENIKGYLMCFTGIVTWSFSEIIVKLLQGTISAVSLSFLRFFLGGLFMIPLMFLQKDLKDLDNLLKKNFWLLIIASMFGLGISNVIYFSGIHLTQANVGSAIYTSYPIFVSIYGYFILKERENMKLKMIGFIIGFIGTAILITDFQFQLFLESGNILGNIMVLLGAIIWSLYSVLGKYIFRRNPEISNIEIKYTMISFLLSCVPIFLIMIWNGEVSNLFQYSLYQWSLILFLSFIGTGFGLFIFFIGIRKIEVSKGISLALLKPIIATIAAFFILNEIPTFSLIVAIPLVSIAVIIINKKPK